MPNINIKKQFYAMATVDNDSAEISLYGDVVESWPVNYWTGEKLEGSYICQDEFLKDLEAVSKVKNLTIRINSYGGDTAVGFVIHNRLRELAGSGVNLTCIVDGVAMSAASVIMCACDTVKINPSALVMVHRCWSILWGGYNADELRQQADAQEAYDKAICSAYQRKTGLSETVLMHMMADTTYMTGKEAVEKGFCDELLDAEPVKIAASADGRSLFINGQQMHLTPGMFAPDFIPTVDASQEATANNTELTAEVPAQPNAAANNNLPDASGEEGGTLMNPEELRQAHPEAVAQIEAAAREAALAESPNAAEQERNRIREIDELANLYDAETIREAKYGDKPMTAAQMAYEAAKKAAATGTTLAAAMQEDAKESGAAAVAGVPAKQDSEEKTADEVYKEARAFAKSLKEDK